METLLGGQVNADWAITDNTNKAFIKNKPDLTVYATKEELETECVDKINQLNTALKNGFTTASLTVSGETSVPTPSTENNSKTIANTEFVHGVVNNLVNGAPTALDTLQELATALGNDPNFSTTILNKIGEKESKADAQIEHKRLQDAVPTKVSQLTNDSGYITKADITEGSTPDLTPYMKKNADSDLTMNNHTIDIGDSSIDGSTGDFMIQTTGGVEIITGGDNMHLEVNGDAVATQNYVKANYVPLSNGHISINGSELWIE